MSLATLSPRVVVALASLPETGLLGPGSLVRHRAFFRFPDGTDVDALARAESPRLNELRLRVQTVSGRQEQLGRSIENIHAFLSLTGFIALFLGAIGVASAIHVHIRQKLATVAILRCLGASSRQCFVVWLAQGLALGVTGAGLGAALGVAVQLALPATLTLHTMLPVDVAFFISWPAVTRGFLAGLGICFLFTLLPLLAVRRVPPLQALRAACEPPAPQTDPLRWSVHALIVAAILGFALWQTGRWTHALGFVGGLLAGLATLAGIARLLMAAARRAVRLLPGIAGGYAWRQGISNLYRPNNRTLLLLLSLGLGAFLLLTLGLARGTLVAQLSGNDGRDRPNLMLFDIQEDQVTPLADILRGQGAEIRDSAPIVTMRLASIKGVPVADLLREPGNDIPRWTLHREYRSTYRGALTASEKQVAGEFTGHFPGNTGGEDIVPVSLETGLAKDMRLALGDELVFDVQGVPMRTRLTSLREVEWRQLTPNFFVVFPEGVLESAPQFHVMAVRTATAADSARVQQAVTQALPNISAIDLAMVMQTLDSIFSGVEAVVRFIALFTLGTGIIVLAGAVLASRGQRVREIVLLRALGASEAQLMRIQISEYAALGLCGALTGATLAMAANIALARLVFAAPPAFPAGLLAGATLGITALAVLTGLLASRGLTRQPPLAVLRQEE
jgi:putative ABC transport system permease protein